MSKETKIKDTKRVIVDDLHGTDMSKYFAFLQSEGAIPISREYIPLFADEACVEPCQLLYDMGLKTVNSGANVDGKENVKDWGFIGIDYISMSDENKLIADELEKKGLIEPINRNSEERGAFIVYLKVPLDSETTVGEVERNLLHLAGLFQAQDVLYGRKTMEEIQSDYKDNSDGTYYCKFLHGNVTYEEMKQFIEEDLQQLFYDGEKYYYITEDLLNIHINYINNNKKNK